MERGGDVIASTATAALLASVTAAQRDRAVASGLIPAASAEEFKATRVVPATHTFDPRAGLVLRFGHEDVRIVFPGAAHSIDNVAIDFPSRGVLFGGCMVRSADSLGPTEGTDLQQWSDAIAKLQMLKPSVVIPGHGIRYDAKQLDDTRALLSAAIAAAH
jgi:glyoxylase-like metal-dependent hydrolase (beta-lactamase superfamily II)